MRIILHPKLYSDVSGIMEYYERSGAVGLADVFYQELMRCFNEAAERPGSFAARPDGLRRVNLRRFPYHVLFRVVEDTARMLVVRHHKRHPSFGITRR